MRKLPVQRAFTLLEFLVVLVIIIVLVLVLWPVYVRSPQTAYRSTCQSNLKQIGMALQMYLQDYDDRLPPFATGSMAQPVTFPALLNPYIKNGRVWGCPRDKREGRDFDGTPGDGTVDYGYNWLALAPNGVGVLLREVRSPADTVALVETGSYLATPAALAGGGGESAPSDRHGPATAVGWLDGHVKWMRREVLDQTAGEENGQPLGVGIDGFTHWNLK